MYSVGIGITDECNYNCKHCYSRPRSDKFTRLNFNSLKKLCESIKINSINFGTGESILHPDFKKMIKYIHKRGIKMSLTTNGLSINKLSDDKVKLFNDIDFSLDFPSKKDHDAFRRAGAFDNVINGIKKCKRLGVECSIVLVIMNSNYKEIPNMLSIAKELGVNLRLNVYKPKYNKNLKLTYHQFWTAIKSLFDNSKIISCSEPVINALIKHECNDGGSPCGKHSLRIKPDGGIIPCVYWNKNDFVIKDLITKQLEFNKSNEFRKARIIPSECKDCELVEYCKGGCSARRLYNNINKKDEYCFIDKKWPKLNVEWATPKDLVHSGYLCTIIVEPKGDFNNERR